MLILFGFVVIVIVIVIVIVVVVVVVVVVVLYFCLFFLVVCGQKKGVRASSIDLILPLNSIGLFFLDMS